MLVARSGLDWEGRRLRASELAGVSSKPSISERCNLRKEKQVALFIRYHLISSIDGFHGAWLSILSIYFQRATGGVCVQNAGKHKSPKIGNK